jgi:NADP-dependent 3-hydroxy acid dehydrogenase YdfG
MLFSRILRTAALGSLSAVAATSLTAPRVNAAERSGGLRGGGGGAPRREQLWSLQGRTAVVTGGSKGLGRAVVEELLAQGVTVLTCARDVTPLQGLLEAEPRCKAVVADVSTAAGRATLLGAMKDEFGEDGLDILVNNVGTNLRKPSTEYTEEEYDALQATNQGSAFHLSAACFEALRRKKGCIINVSSVSGSTSDSTGALYHMHKAAVEHMSTPRQGSNRGLAGRRQSPLLTPSGTVSGQRATTHASGARTACASTRWRRGSSARR